MSEEIEEKEGIFAKYKKLIIGGTTSITAFTSVVFAYIDAKTDAITESVKSQVEHQREITEERNASLEKQLDKIENILIRIDDRIYNLTKRGQ